MEGWGLPFFSQITFSLFREGVGKSTNTLKPNAKVNTYADTQIYAREGSQATIPTCSTVQSKLLTKS